MGKYLRIIRNVEKKVNSEYAQFQIELKNQIGLSQYLLGDIRIIDLTKLSPLWGAAKVERALSFGFSVKTWSNRLKEEVFLVADDEAKEKLRRVLLEQKAIYTLKERNLILQTRLTHEDLRPLNMMNSSLGTTIVRLAQTDKD